MTVKLLKKISSQTVCPDLLTRLDVAGAPRELVLYDVYGMVADIKRGSTEKGEWLKFTGQFEAIVDKTGEIYQSGAIFIPQPFEDMLYSEVCRAKEADPNGTVQFACRVSIVPPTKGKVSATGYEYRCTPLIDSSEESPLAKMRKLIGEKRALLLSSSNPDNGTKVAAEKKQGARA